MKTCPDCKKEYDTDDPSCPDCAPPKKPNKVGIAAAALLGLVLAGLISGGLYWRTVSQTPPPGPAQAPLPKAKKENEMKSDRLEDNFAAESVTLERDARQLGGNKAIVDEKRRKGSMALDIVEPNWEERYREREQEAAMKYRMPPLDAPITVTMKKGDVLRGILKEVHNDGIFLQTGPAEISVGRSQMHMKSRVLLYEDDFCRNYAETWVAREKADFAKRRME